MAFPSFDPAKHPHGFHGHFAPSGGGMVRRKTTFRAESIQPRSLREKMPAAQERARKARIKMASEPARGIRPPANFEERMRLIWASPRKMAEQKAKTGDYLMPRRDAVRTARMVAGGFRNNVMGTQGSRLTFTGKRIPIRGMGTVAGMRGGKLTSRGRFNAARRV